MESVASGEEITGDWNRLPPPARRVFAIGGALGSVSLALMLIAIAVVFGLATESRIFVKTYATAAVAWTLLGTIQGRIRWAHTFWRLDHIGLHIRHGKWWRSETLVPRVRVQHLDIARGPLARRYGLASLVVYTAGTASSSVTLAGLLDAEAIALRDALIPEPVEDDDAV